MKHNLYSIRDRKGSFYSPRLAQNEASAIRDFAYMVNNPDGMMAFAPADFELYLVGSFDLDTGVIEPVAPVQFVASGSSLVGVVNYEK